MSTFTVLVLVGFASVIGACVLHDHIDTVVVRATFVVAALLGVGVAAIGYCAMWVIAGQVPSFLLTPIFGFGLTMVATALVYSATYVLLQQRDIAPSR